ncbi:MAG: hypothetical protein P8166_05540 [Candidatus Thiodiazotropha sp.]
MPDFTGFDRPWVKLPSQIFGGSPVCDSRIQASSVSIDISEITVNLTDRVYAKGKKEGGLLFDAEAIEALLSC